MGYDLGQQARAVQGDVAKAADVEKIFAETKQAFGRLDILVNNAGVYNLLPLEEFTEEDVAASSLASPSDGCTTQKIPTCGVSR